MISIAISTKIRMVTNMTMMDPLMMMRTKTAMTAMTKIIVLLMMMLIKIKIKMYFINMTLRTTEIYSRTYSTRSKMRP